MPMVFAAILASLITLIATSTNVVVSGLMVQFGLPPIGMFELTPVGLPVLVVGILYMVLVGQRLIPVRRLPQTLTETFEMRPYLAELRSCPAQTWWANPCWKPERGGCWNLTVLVIIRGDQRISPDATTTLEAGDALLVEGSYDAILKVKDLLGIAIQAAPQILRCGPAGGRPAPGRSGGAARLDVPAPHDQRSAVAREVPPAGAGDQPPFGDGARKDRRYAPEHGRCARW